MKKITKILLIIVCCVLVLGMGCTSFFSVKAYQLASQAYGSDEEEDGGQTQEDDVCIADEYYIRSTKEISDAYKAGDVSGLDDRQRETLDMAKSVMDQVITDDMTDFEKEKAIYDWMCANLAGDSNLLTVLDTSSGSDVDNPYGVLKYHNAVCVGYATTFRLFMQLMDIDCMVIHNSEEYHSWDLVQLDGQWYHTDIYSDVGSGNYAHFNLNDAMISEEGDWDTSFFPAADGLAYNISYQNMTAASSVNAIPALIRQNMDEDQYTMCIKLDFDLDDNAQTQLFYMMNILSGIFDSMDSEESGDYYYLDNQGLLQDGDDYVLYLSVDHQTSSGIGVEDGSPDQDMVSALKDAFSDVEGIDSIIQNYANMTTDLEEETMGNDYFSYYDETLQATVIYEEDGSVTVNFDNGESKEFESSNDFESTIGTGERG